MQILLINHNGGGFADHITIPDGTTVTKLFDDRVGGDPADFLIRVNRQPVAADEQLREGDRISITPVRIEGAV